MNAFVEINRVKHITDHRTSHFRYVLQNACAQRIILLRVYFLEK